MKKSSKKSKEGKLPKKKVSKSASKRDVIATIVAPLEKGSVPNKTAQPLPVYEVRERKVVADRGIGQLLSQARMQWQFGEWEKLCQIDLLHIEHHPDRAELALLAGCGALQIGEQEKAKAYLNAAEEWDCDKRLMFQLLLSGVHHSLGRYNAIIENQEKADKMLYLGGIGLGGDVNLIADIRRTKEHPRLGLDQLTTQKNVPRLEQESEPQLEVGFEVAEEEFSMEKAIEEASRAERPFKEGITSYAQNFEDVMLWRALGHIKNGFYIDIGAHDPIIDSVSNAFYEKGWKGVHVEALSEYANKLKIHRPDEIVIHAAVSDSHGEIKFGKTEGVGGLSTGSSEYIKNYLISNFKLEISDLKTITLCDIFTFVGEKEIHWLKIDVEGMERKVLEGWGKNNIRPWLIVVESTLPNSRIENYKEWENILIRKKYRFVYFDGLNRFYVRLDKDNLAKHFIIPPNVFDNLNINKNALR